MRRVLFLILLMGVILAAPAATRPAVAATDEDVIKAIEKAKEFLIGQQQGDGLWPDQKWYEAPNDYGNSETVFFTLAYISKSIGPSINSDTMTKSLDAIVSRNLDDYTYAISMRAMGLAHIEKSLLKSSPKRDQVHMALKADALRLITGQGGHGGWNYRSLGGGNGRFDFSNSQLAVLALREAAMAGVEIPDAVWQRSQKLFFERQQGDGGWNYGELGNQGMGANVPGYGSMTAVGLASIFITADFLDLNSGCPCRAGVSNKTRGDLENRVDRALKWLSGNFAVDQNPKAPEGAKGYQLYWLYAVERVGMAAGYKYFGDHNWYKDGVEHLLKTQQPNGSWGSLSDTCFGLLFLFKGRAPILYNKLEFKGDWNNHRRDVANLTGYIESKKEQMFNWQIVNLKSPVEELHDAPVLYITAETPPQFTDDEKKKLRAFTDTGGTIFLEASCGNAAVRTWAKAFIAEMWPEWPLKALGPDHGTFTDPNPLKQRPEILGVDDGVRTIIFYAMDDISCHWQTRAVAGKDYLFLWGINLFSYATDKAPLRFRLSGREAPKTDRYNSPLKAGDKATIQLARLKHDGTAWMANRNYKGFDRIVADLQKKGNITLKVDDSGIAAAALQNQECAYLTGNAAVNLSEPDRAALKAYIGKGGFLWAEAADGSSAFDRSFSQLAAAMGWQIKPLTKEDPLMSGKFNKALGYNIAQGVQFSRAMRIQKAGPRAFADLLGIYQDNKLVGVYSPFDIVYSTTGYEAYARRGYQPEDALAVADNIVAFLTDRGGAE